MMPSLVVSAHDEWIFVPTKYRLSNTFAGSVYQVSRGGGGGGATSGPGAVCGATQTRTSVPVKSKPAAFLARARYASYGLADCARAAAAPIPMQRPRAAPMTRCMLSSLTTDVCWPDRGPRRAAGQGTGIGTGIWHRDRGCGDGWGAS